MECSADEYDAANGQSVFVDIVVDEDDNQLHYYLINLFIVVSANGTNFFLILNIHYNGNTKDLLYLFRTHISELKILHIRVGC